MLDYRDLRPGNLVVFSQSGDFFEIEEVSKTGLLVKNENEETWIELDQFEGIPLSKEWMYKWGFKFRSPGIGGQDQWAGYGFWYLGEFILIGDLNFRKLWFQRNQDWEFQYVHEVQNLYRTLEKREIQD